MRGLQVLLLVALTSCASRSVTPIKVTPKSPNYIPYSIQLGGLLSIASACPIDRWIVTATHVTLPWLAIPNISQVGLSWSTPSGLRGYLQPVSYSLDRDIAFMQLALTNDIPHFWPAAEKTPSRGDQVVWVEYNYDRQKGEILETVQREAKVLRLLGGYVQFNGRPMPGASGGCLWNDRGEVVGLVVSGIGGTGLAVSTSGYWWTGE